MLTALLFLAPGRCSLQIDVRFSPLEGFGKGRLPAPVDVKFERMEDDHNMIYTLQYVPSLPGSYSIDVKASLGRQLPVTSSSVLLFPA